MDTKLRDAYDPEWNLDGLLNAAVLGAGVLIVTVAAALAGHGERAQSAPMAREALLQAASWSGAKPDCVPATTRVGSSRRGSPAPTSRFPT